MENNSNKKFNDKGFNKNGFNKNGYNKNDYHVSGTKVTYQHDLRDSIEPHKLYLPTPKKQINKKLHNIPTKKRSRKSSNNNNTKLNSSPKRSRMTENNIIIIEKKIQNINNRLLDCKKEEFHKKYEDELKQVEEDFTKTMDEFITDLSHLHSDSSIQTIKNNINNNYNKAIDNVKKKYKIQCKNFRDTLYNKREIQQHLLEHYYQTKNSNKKKKKNKNTIRRVLPLGMPPRLDLGVDHAAAPARAPAPEHDPAQNSQFSQLNNLRPEDLFRMNNGHQ